jgi:hypothetical protein
MEIMETLELALHLGYTAFQNRYSREFSSHPRAMKLTEARKDATLAEMEEAWYRGWDAAAEWAATPEEEIQGITLKSL